MQAVIRHPQICSHVYQRKQILTAPHSQRLLGHSSCVLRGPCAPAILVSLFSLILRHKLFFQCSLFCLCSVLCLYSSYLHNIIYILPPKKKKKKWFAVLRHYAIRLYCCAAFTPRVLHFINPRRACAARVTVVVLCVCLSVCLFVCLSASILALQATRRLMSDTSSFSATRAGRKNNVAILLKRLRSRDMA